MQKWRDTKQFLDGKKWEQMHYVQKREKNIRAHNDRMCRVKKKPRFWGYKEGINDKWGKVGKDKKVRKSKEKNIKINLNEKHRSKDEKNKKKTSRNKKKSLGLNLYFL